MSEKIALAMSHDSKLAQIPTGQKGVGPTTERTVLHILGGMVGALLVCSLGFLGLVTYVSLSTPTAESPRLVCPPICKVESR